ncbi:MAG: SRPBCC domain-containing protein [Chloroflexota bacterium]
MSQLQNTATMRGKNTLVWERTLPISPEQLWATIATKEGLAHWFMPTTEAIQEGGRFSFEGGWDGTIVEVSPPHAIQFNPDDDEGSYQRFEVTACEDGCIFQLIDRVGASIDATEIFFDTPPHHIYQPGGPGTHWSGVAAGYHCFVDELEGYATGVEVAFDYDELCHGYVVLLDGWF